MARTQASRSAPYQEIVQFPRRKTRLDTATLLGLLGAFGLLGIAMIIGGSPASFFHVPALLIVIGGTLGVTTICFSIEEIFRAQKIAFKAVVRTPLDPQRAAVQMIQASEIARKRGILALQDALVDLEREPFARKAVMMVVDGSPAEEIERVLKHDIGQMQQRHGDSANILYKAADVSPAMGLIGTLIGLVQMLGNLDDPATIGPSMAVALLTTFYGAILATMVFSPLANKLERNSATETLIYNIYMLAATSICRKENPRRLEMLLNALLPPAKRLRYFD